MCFAAIASAAPTSSAEKLVLEVLEASTAVVVGEIDDVEQLAHAGWSATLQLEQTLRGHIHADVALRIAWEEPAPSKPSRWKAGDRVLLSLEPLPTASIWATRVPDETARSSLLAPAIGGTLDQPSGADVIGLKHYLALPGTARRSPAGLGQLAHVAESASEDLAVAAIERMAGHQAFDDEWPTGVAQSFVRILSRRDAPQPAEALLDLLSTKRPPAILPALEARLAVTDPPAPAIVYRALGAVRGGLPSGLSEQLLAAASPEERRAAARFATGERAQRKLERLSSIDSDPEVRASAVARLLELQGDAALDVGLRALGDPDPGTRRAAVYGMAKLGAEAVSRLEAFAHDRSDQEAQNAVATLAMMGSASRPALARLATEHPELGVRSLARMAMGLPVGHDH